MRSDEWKATEITLAEDTGPKIYNYFKINFNLKKKSNNEGLNLRE